MLYSRRPGSISRIRFLRSSSRLVFYPIARSRYGSYYPRVRIWRPTFERQRDFNPPDQRAAQRTLRRSPTSPARACPSCGDEPSRTGLRYLKACWRYPGSRACCFLACAGSNDYAGPNSHSRLTRLPVLPSSYSPWSRHPDLRFFEAQSPRPLMPPAYASQHTSRHATQD